MKVMSLLGCWQHMFAPASSSNSSHHLGGAPCFLFLVICNGLIFMKDCKRALVKDSAGIWWSQRHWKHASIICCEPRTIHVVEIVTITSLQSFENGHGAVCQCTIHFWRNLHLSLLLSIIAISIWIIFLLISFSMLSSFMLLLCNLCFFCFFPFGILQSFLFLPWCGNSTLSLSNKIQPIAIIQHITNQDGYVPQTKNPKHPKQMKYNQDTLFGQPLLDLSCNCSDLHQFASQVGLVLWQ